MTSNMSNDNGSHFKFHKFSRRKRVHLNEDRSKYYKKSKEAKDFRYGNYHQYYGYRNQGNIDQRLVIMKEEWFKCKDILDIGCNSGHFTLSVAKDFKPKSVIGIDIDNELVQMAKRNVRHYIDHSMFSCSDFPSSFVLSYGPVAQNLDPKCRYSYAKFPFNVQFVQANYILPSDEMLQWQESSFDTVLCLSLTKWIHLNWGDEGVKRLFHRAYAHLRPGGYFILEAQAYQSYARKKKLTEEIFEHYKEIKFYPELFNEYLLKEVGFKTCELIDIPPHEARGFSRPIYLFVKGEDCATERKPRHIVYDTDSSCDYSDFEQLSD